MKKEDFQAINEVLEKEKLSTGGNGIVFFYEDKGFYKLEKISIEENEDEDKIFRELIEKIKVIAEYIHSHIGAVTWISTAVIATVSVLLRFEWYVYQSGKLSYWKISSEAINVGNDNLLYEIFLSFVWGIIAIATLCVPMLIMQLKSKLIDKIAKITVWNMILFVIFCFAIDAAQMISSGGWMGVLGVLVSFLICLILYYAVCWLILKSIKLSDKKHNKRQERKKKLIIDIICGISFLIGTTVYIFFLGKMDASIQSEYRIVKYENVCEIEHECGETCNGAEYAIVYESKDYYYLIKFENNELTRDYQKIVEKGNINFYWNGE